MEKLTEFLRGRGGRCIASIDKPSDGAIHFWLCDQRILIVNEHGDNRGWEVYRPVSGSLRIDETLEALTAYLDA